MVCTVAPGSSVEYCLKEQEEYYLGGRESAGQWYCPEQQFGLVDGMAIDNGAFRNLHEGLSADGSEQIGKANAQGDRVGGYDVQFGAPKSVSVLWALADGETRQKIEDCHAKAVRAGLDFFQQAGAQIRTGHNGVEIEKTQIFGATFQHGESRPTERDDGAFRSDPQLHTHSIIFNLGQGADGEWRALDGRPLMSLQKAAGAQYHAELALLLEQELGARIERKDLVEGRHNGEFAVAGVPAELVEQFSTRRNQINAEMAKHGLETGEALELADEIALATREGKSRETRDDQRARWTDEAAASGYSWEQLRDQALGQTLDQTAHQARADAREDSLIAVAERLTENESIFTKADLYAQLAAAGAGRGVGAIDVQALEAELVAQGTIVALATDEKGFSIYSTRELIQIESEIQTLAAEQAAAFPVTSHQQESDHDAISRPRPIDDNFDFASAIPELDDRKPAARFEADLHGLHILPCQSLGRDAAERPVFLSDQARLYIHERAAAGAAAVRRADDPAEVRAPHTIDAATIDAYIAARAAKGEALTDEQETAVHWIGCHGGTHVVVEGGAGTGKTVSVAQSTADLYFDMDYKVYATAQRWVTALDLANIKLPNGQNVEGRAAAKWIADHKAGKVQFDSRTVLLVDEAGQMGSRDAHALMQIARDTGMRVLWTGDRKQQKSASAGDPMTLLAKELGSFRLNESQRMRATAADVLAWRDGLDAAEAHKQAMALAPDERLALVAEHGKSVESEGKVWARKMADDFAHGRAEAGLQALIDHDQLVWSDTHDQSLDAAVADWAAYKAENPNATAIVSAARHVDVRTLNDRMRDHLRETGQIGDDLAIVPALAPNGDRFDLALAVGDQVRIGANLKDLAAYNGMIAIIREIQPGSKAAHPLVTLDLHTPQGVREIQIETQRLVDEKSEGRARLAHAYAATTTLIQGATVNADFSQTTSRDRSNNVYVAASRARDLTKLYACRETENLALKQRLPLVDRPKASFTDDERQGNLARALSREQVKKMTTDFQVDRTPATAVLEAAAELAAVREAGEENDMRSLYKVDEHVREDLSEHEIQVLEQLTHDEFHDLADELLNGSTPEEMQEIFLDHEIAKLADARQAWQDQKMDQLAKAQGAIDRFLIADQIASSGIVPGEKAQQAIQQAEDVRGKASKEIAWSTKMMTAAEEMGIGERVIGVSQQYNERERAEWARQRQEQAELNPALQMLQEAQQQAEQNPALQMLQEAQQRQEQESVAEANVADYEQTDFHHHEEEHEQE